MKKIVVGLVLILSLGLVACASDEKFKDTGLTESEVNTIIENRKATKEEYTETIKYLVKEIYNCREPYVKKLQESKDITDKLKEIKAYQQKLFDIQKKVEDIHFALVDTEKNKDVQENYFLLSNFMKEYMDSLDYEIEYIRNNDESNLDKAKEAVEKAKQKYEEILSL